MGRIVMSAKVPITRYAITLPVIARMRGEA